MIVSCWLLAICSAFWLCACVNDVSEPFRFADHLPAAFVAKNPLIVQEMQRYVDLHHREAVLADAAFCSRTFALGIYGGPQGLGNHVHEFMNALAGAFVTNRTIYWKFCDRRGCLLDNEGDFAEVLERHSWILSQRDYEQAWAKHGCAGSSSPPQLLTHYHRAQAEETLMCCGIDSLPQQVVDFGTHEAHQMLGLAMPNVRLGAAAKHRAEQLFTNGEDVAYGLLFRLAFSFRRETRLANDALLRGTEGSVLFGVHLRHATNEETHHSQDELGQQCLRRLVKQHRGDRKCIILLASDRAESFEHWHNATQARPSLQGCRLLYSNHSRAHTSWNEHGPFTGHIAVADLDLLSRAHLLIGSSYLLASYRTFSSTFSLLIAALRATSTATNNSSSSELKELRPRYLPDCEEVLGARRDTKRMFLNAAAHKCVPPYIEHNIDMPTGCLP